MPAEKKNLPAKYALSFLLIFAMLLSIAALDRWVMEDFPAVDALYLLPIIVSAILLGPIETVLTGLFAMTFSLTVRLEAEELQYINLWTSTALGLAGILAAAKAMLIRRFFRRVSAPREALENSPLAYAEFKFPGYSLTNYNATFERFLATAGGQPQGTLFDSLPEKPATDLAKLMDKTVSSKERVDSDEFSITTHSGTNFWRINFIPLLADGRQVPRSVALFAIDITPAVHRTHTQEAALKISSAVMSSLDLENTIRVALDNLAYIAETNAAALFMLEDDQWVGMAGYGEYDEDMVKEMRFPYEDLLPAVDAVEQKKAVSSENPHDDPKFSTESIVRFGAKSCLVVPLVSGNRAIGCVWLNHIDEPRHFSPEQVEFVTAIGSHAALAIENATIYENEHFIRKAMEAIEAISEAGLVSLDLEEVLMEIVNRTQDVMKMDSALIFLADDIGANLIPRAVTGAMREYASEIIIPVGSGIVGRTFNEGVPMKIDNLQENSTEGSFFAETDIRSVLTVPLRIGGKVEGVLTIGCHREKAFSAREWGLIQVLADRASMAVQNSLLHDATKKELTRVQLLRDVAAACASSQDLRKIAERALSAVYEQMGCFRASVYYLDTDQDGLVNLAFMGHAPKVMDEFLFSPLDRGTLLTRAVNEGRIITHEEVDLSNASESEGYILKALNIGDNRRCTVPIIYKDEVIGGMALVWPDTKPFSPRALETVASIANQLAVAIHSCDPPGLREPGALTASGEPGELAVERDIDELVAKRKMDELVVEGDSLTDLS